MKPADWGWSGIAVAVLGYEACAARTEWELLSEAADRYRARHPVLTNTIICYLALHLLRAIPRRWDPLHRIAERAGR